MATTAEVQIKLTAAELSRLDQLEAAVSDGLGHALNVGKALAEIRSQRLYRADFDNFATYVREKWGISRDYADRLIQASEIADDLPTIVSKQPADKTTPIVSKPIREGQVRPLAALPKEKRKEAWDKAAESAGGQPTGKQVQAAVDEVLAKPTLLSKRTPVGFEAVEVSETAGETAAEVEEDHAERQAIKDEISDDAWLDAMPERAKLSDACRRTFDAEALAWRHLEPARRAYMHAYSREVKGKRRGPFIRKVGWAMSIDDPTKWHACPPEDKGGCNGTGQVPLVGKCTQCDGVGYCITK